MELYRQDKKKLFYAIPRNLLEKEVSLRSRLPGEGVGSASGILSAKEKEDVGSEEWKSYNGVGE